MEPLCCKPLLCKEERWKIATCSELLTNQQMDKVKPQHLPPNSPDYQLPKQMYTIHWTQAKTADKA